MLAAAAQANPLPLLSTPQAIQPTWLAPAAEFLTRCPSLAIASAAAALAVAFGAGVGVGYLLK